MSSDLDNKRPVATTSQKVLRSTLGGLLTALPVIVIGLLIILLAPKYYMHLTMAAFLNLIIVVGLQTFMGNSNVTHFGHTSFVGIGAYAVAILATPVAMKHMSIPDAPFGLADIAIHPAAAAVVALVIVAIIAVLSGRIIANISGVAASIISLAFLIITHAVFINWTDLFKGNQAFFGVPTVIDLPWLMVFASLAIVVARIFKDSDWGLQLRATAQSPQAAAALGIDSVALRFRAWVLSAIICGLAGILYAYFVGTISPKLFYFQMVFMTLAMLILGGMATVTGAVAGAIILSVGLEIIRSLESGVVIAGIQLPQLLGLSGIALGLVIVLCMAFRPDGVVGRYELDEYLVRMLRRN
ncbi:branched-chain amino acid ABC transporter permease [Mesorhizobium sp. 2RAF21]|uniref:branched-chain amino acid ABC transporter permease n=1 Tax=Mesorhizobium sp. 2RAF21 TaxID=3232995 RepID=UPI003F98C793